MCCSEGASPSRQRATASRPASTKAARSSFQQIAGSRRSYCLRIAFANSVGDPAVLNRSPLTDTVFPAASPLSPETSSKRISSTGSTLIEVTAAVAPVNSGESDVSVNVPSLLMVPTWPVICDGRRYIRSVVIVVTPPADVTICGRICTSWPTSRSPALPKLSPVCVKPRSSPISSLLATNVALGRIVTTTADPSATPLTVGSSLNTTAWNCVLLSTLVMVALRTSSLACSSSFTRLASIVPMPLSFRSTSTICPIATQLKFWGFAVHPALSKSSNTLLLSTLMVNDCPLLSFINVNMLVPTPVTWPSTSSASSMSSWSSSRRLCVTFTTLTMGLTERSLCSESFTLKSNLIPNVSSAVTAIGKGLVNVAVDGLKLGVIWQTVLLAHEPIAAPEWFTIVSTALPNVRVRLL